MFFPSLNRGLICHNFRRHFASQNRATEVVHVDDLLQTSHIRTENLLLQTCSRP